MQEEEEIKGRFADEIKNLGISKNAIAGRIGFSAQTFTNVTKGRNLPSLLLLKRLQEVFPSFDSNYVIHGERKDDDSFRVKELLEELDFQKAIVSKLVGKHKGVSNHPQVDREGASEMLSKCISGRHFQSLLTFKVFKGRDN
ncbi:hypothetical protein [Dyadobacter sandarakinus]|uniref:HTH cro/C1-type domain-containing protein n=1 Tax=Dyadobacter sandarakinus TaxID=2747268 RepID=A0ABX7I242_9BACT|nr:hypothetical protein [Dyadobacter sandarakinus]QRQ99772.1 hypothetical protein HWI92_01970 [Dyadobacter sandarakinus]